MRQVWKDLLFLHWPVAPELLRPVIPEGLELDLFEGMAWIGIVPFDMQGVTARGCPAPKAFCDFPEINVRTYVKRDGIPGVWFFSLDVNKSLPVWAANTFFHLPYFKAEVSVQRENGRIQYQHQRNALMFDAVYQPVSKPFSPDPGSFDDWSTTRYCLYARSRRGSLYRGHIHHSPWPLQPAEVEIRSNTLLDEFPIGQRHPSTLYSKELHVVVYPLERLNEKTIGI
jgi:uncharacterized protein YqjF (DUF2071 family)